MTKVQKPTLALGRKKGNRKEGGKEEKENKGARRGREEEAPFQ